MGSKRSTKRNAPSSSSSESVDQNDVSSSSSSADTSASLRKLIAKPVPHLIIKDGKYDGGSDSTEKSTEKPTRESSKTLTKKSTEKPLKESTKKPTEKSSKKPTEKSTKKPIEKPTKESTKKPTETPPTKPNTSDSDSGDVDNIKYMDESAESDDSGEDAIAKQKKESLSFPKKVDKYSIFTHLPLEPMVESIFLNRKFLAYHFVDPKTYNFRSWKECYPKRKIQLKSMIRNPEWMEFMNRTSKEPYYANMERLLSEYILAADVKMRTLPPPELTFNSINCVNPRDIRLVVLGQDPYANTILAGRQLIAQAMGLSFSVPLGSPIQPSLKNIYLNLYKYGHLREYPKTGCLASWCMQGCLMINSSFTVYEGKFNSHKNIWMDFSADLIKYINDTCESVVFLAFGSDAHQKCLNVDPYRHHIITSSHPSPRSFNTSMNGKAYGPVKNGVRKDVSYKPFELVDFGGQANEYLISKGKQPIIWDTVNA